MHLHLTSTYVVVKNNHILNYNKDTIIPFFFVYIFIEATCKSVDQKSQKDKKKKT